MADTLNKKFLCLNGNIQGNSARVVFQNQIDSNGLIDDFIYSYNFNGISKFDKIISVEDFFGISKETALKSTNLHIIIQRYDDIDLTTPNGEYKLDENIIESISYKKPFIFIGRRGYLKYLHTLGYKTFSHFWNESYNDEIYWIDSIVKVISILKELQKKDSLLRSVELESILIHNYGILKNDR
jgi:hypothetical protein